MSHLESVAVATFLSRRSPTYCPARQAVGLFRIRRMVPHTATRWTPRDPLGRLALTL